MTPVFIEDDAIFVDELKKSGQIPESTTYLGTTKREKPHHYPSYDGIHLEHSCGCQIKPLRKNLRRGTSVSPCRAKHAPQAWNEVLTMHPKLEGWSPKSFHPDDSEHQLVHSCGSEKTGQLEDLIRDPICRVCQPSTVRLNRKRGGELKTDEFIQADFDDIEFMKFHGFLVDDITYIGTTQKKQTSQDVFHLKRNCGCIINPTRANLNRAIAGTVSMAKNCLQCRPRSRRTWLEFIEQYPEMSTWTPVKEHPTGWGHQSHEFRHACGFIRKTTTSNLQRNPACTSCLRKSGISRRTKPLMRTLEEYLERNPDREPVFTNWSAKRSRNREWTFTHICGCKKITTSIHHFNGLCPACDTGSFGEKAINHFLLANNVNYEREFMFPNSRKRFDFALLDRKIVIEYDGVQHTKDVTHWDVKAKASRQNDWLKDQLALQHGWTVYRIDHTHDSYLSIYQKLKQILPELEYVTVDVNQTPLYFKIKDWLRTNQPMSQLADELNVPLAKIQRHIRRHPDLNSYYARRQKRIQIATRGGKYSEDVRADAVKYVENNSISSAAKQYNIPESTIANWFKLHHNISYAEWRRTNPTVDKHPLWSDKQRILDWMQTNETLTSFAARHDAYPALILRIIKSDSKLEKAYSNRKDDKTHSDALKISAVEYAKQTSIKESATKHGTSQVSMGKWFRQLTGMKYSEWKRRATA